MNPQGLLGRTVPEAEREFVSALMVDPGRIGDARLMVAPDQIEDQHTRSVLSLLYAEDDANRTIKGPALVDALEKAGLHTPDGGWTSFVEFLSYEAISSAYLTFHGNVITEGHRSRMADKLMRAAQLDLSESRPGTGECDEVIDRLDAGLVALEERGSEIQENAGAFESATDLVESIERGETYGGVQTELLDLDDKLLGMRPGEMYVIGARPGCGKTTLALQIALNAANAGVRTVFFSLEVQTSELSERLISNISGIESQDIRRRSLSREQKIKARNALDQIPKSLQLMTDAGTSTHKLRGILRRWKRKHGLGLAVIDYLGLLSAPGAENRVREVSVISSSLKELSKELACPFLVCCQLNRTADGDAPRLSHLRESGSIEQDSDVVLLLSADPQGSVLDCNIAKNRHGQTGPVKLSFVRETFRVRNFGLVQGEELP